MRTEVSGGAKRSARAMSLNPVTETSRGQARHRCRCWVTDLLGGRVEYYFAPISAVLSNINDGKLRAIAVSSAKRSSSLPNVPTVAESGVPGFEFTLWFGMWGPAGVPANIVDKISKDVNRALADPGVRERLAKLGNDPMEMTPAQFSQFVHQEVADYARVIKAAGIKPQ